MLPRFNPAKLVLTAALTASLVGPLAMADDTEIFVAEPPAGSLVAANILFILDTSGSMDTKVNTQEDWNPNTTFTGTCDRNRVYWITGNAAAPACSTGQWVDKSNFECKTATDKIDVDGAITLSNAAQWDNTASRSRDYAWKDLVSGRRTQVECKADTALTPSHGENVGDGTYPLDGRDGPWGTSKPSDGWWTSNNRNRSYTFYSGNYLNWLKSGGTVQKTRIQIVKDVTKTTLDRLENVNVGLMVYNKNQRGDGTDNGGKVIYPVSRIDTGTTRTDLKKLIDDIVADGNTPLSETMLEAYNYWKGNAPRYSGSDASTIVGGSFNSPLGVEACAKNYIVYLTDGEATSDVEGNSFVPTLTGFSPAYDSLFPASTNPYPSNKCSDDSTGGENGRCLSDIAKILAEQDLYSANGSTKDTVITHTVGFGDDVKGSSTLEATAHFGKGTAYEAGDTASLSDVFETIIREIVKQNVSFTAPAVSVNAFNRTQNLNDLFISVFAPAETLHWPGNLKKYRLTAAGKIVDQNGIDAVDPNTGFFSQTSQSYWSAVVDKDVVPLGGAANKLPLPGDMLLGLLGERNVYSNLTTTKDLTANGNLVVASNAANMPNTAIGLPTFSVLPLVEALDPARLSLVQWIRGGNVDGGAVAALTQRYQMGDPLHARPVSVIYGGSPGSPNLNDAVVYFATNDGYLHAIHPNGVSPSVAAGQELWTFIPKELLARMKTLYDNDDSTTKGYGLDGNLVVYKLDLNSDGIVDSGAGDKVYLFFGMGRGGDSYYAIDVTDKNTPKFMWEQGRDKDMIGLGQSWSTPVITKINIGSSSQDASKLVMVVGGGYDQSQDSIPFNVDNIGNRIFFIDAITGNVLWHAGPTNVTGLGYDATANFTSAKLTHSVPADIRVLDLTNDGFADRMYMADTGGQIWRFDIRNGNVAGTSAAPESGLVVGGVFATLGNAAAGSGPNTSNRRFYNAPDLALLRVDGQMVLNLAIGSGYRGHPINAETQDKFYSLRDYLPFASLSQANYTATAAIVDTDLFDVTTDINPAIPVGSKGWKMSLNQPSWQGEKVLAEARTFGGSILFTSFTPVPAANAAAACTVSGVKNSLYVVNALDARPVVNRDGPAGSAPDSAADRRADLQQDGIAPAAVILFPSPDDPANCAATNTCSPPPVCLVGVEQCGVNFTNTPVRTFWTQQDIDTH